MAKATGVRNRIVGHGECDPLQLLANEKNARVHPPRQEMVLNTSLDKVGWVDEVIINKRTAPEWGADRFVETLVDGHLRVANAITRKERSIPVKYVDLTPDEEVYVLASFDRSTELAQWDGAALQALLNEGLDLSGLWNDDELNELLKVVPNFQPVGIDEQGRLDQKKPITCPHCGEEFVPND